MTSWSAQPTGSYDGSCKLPTSKTTVVVHFQLGPFLVSQPDPTSQPKSFSLPYAKNKNIQKPTSLKPS